MNSDDRSHWDSDIIYQVARLLLWTLDPDFYEFQQQITTLYNWYDMQSIVFTTSSIPVRGETLSTRDSAGKDIQIGIIRYCRSAGVWPGGLKECGDQRLAFTINLSLIMFLLVISIIEICHGDFSTLHLLPGRKPVHPHSINASILSSFITALCWALNCLAGEMCLG